jgi:hypothetical protein
LLPNFGCHKAFEKKMINDFRFSAKQTRTILNMTFYVKIVPGQRFIVHQQPKKHMDSRGTIRPQTAGV